MRQRHRLFQGIDKPGISQSAEGIADPVPRFADEDEMGHLLPHLRFQRRIIATLVLAPSDKRHSGVETLKSLDDAPDIGPFAVVVPADAVQFAYKLYPV